jgi:hypothetical protein
VVAVSAGEYHSLVLTEAGAVLSFGGGGQGAGNSRLGHGDGEEQHTPTKAIEALSGEHVVAVAAGRLHSLVLTEAGAVLSFGFGDLGGLGHGAWRRGAPPHAEGHRGAPWGARGGVGGGRPYTIACARCRTVACLAAGTDETLGLQLWDHQLTPLEYPSVRVW